MFVFFFKMFKYRISDRKYENYKHGNYNRNKIPCDRKNALSYR